MRVYHYLEAKWALDDLRRRRLKVSKIDDMNDPYECRSVCSDPADAQVALDKTAAELARRFGSLCFSRSWKSVLMWSHYAEKHKGMCLGFDVSDEVARPIEYVPAPQNVENLMHAADEEFDSKRGLTVVELMLGAKYDGWSYEQEVREHVRLDERDEETGQYFIDFSELLVLKEVIAGARFPFTQGVIEQSLSGSDRDAGVRIWKVRPSPNSFEMIADENGFAFAAGQG